MKEKEYFVLKAKLWQEIKSLEQEYKRNQTSISELQTRQGDISFEIQKKLDKFEKMAIKRDEQLYENGFFD